MTIDKVANWFSIISGLMTIFGIGGLITWGIHERLSDRLANKIFNIAILMGKLGLLSFYNFLLYHFWKFIYFQMLLYSTGGVNYQTYYWNKDTPKIYLILYIINISGFLFSLIIGSLCILTGSLATIKYIPIRWRRSVVVFDDSNNRAKIIKAEYGGNGSFKDVSEHIKGYINKDNIRFYAGNPLFGDTCQTTIKQLHLELLIDEKPFKKVYAENAEVYIEFDKLKV